jgi:light-independent protochlorophyllide reductase subunit B
MFTWSRPAAQIADIGSADFNVLLYPEIGDTAARWLERTFRQPLVRTIPIGHGATTEFVREVAALAGTDPEPAIAAAQSRMPWWSRSVDSNYLTGKRVFIFGDATHAIAAARVAHEELGFEVVGLGCYNREFARDLREAAAKYGVEPLITDDHMEVEDAIIAAAPELVLGSQMERHIAKRLRVSCAVISAPVHVQDFPARHSPQMGWEGANVLFDSWVHPLTMGLEEHLLTMFRDDFEFSDANGASHHGAVGHAPQASAAPNATEALIEAETMVLEPTEAGNIWTAEAEKELRKIPFFVRGKARKNTERFAAEQGLVSISRDTLYDAKAHYAR